MPLATSSAVPATFCRSFDNHETVRINREALWGDLYNRPGEAGDVIQFITADPNADLAKEGMTWELLEGLTFTVDSQVSPDLERVVRQGLEQSMGALPPGPIYKLYGGRGRLHAKSTYLVPQAWITSLLDQPMELGTWMRANHCDEKMRYSHPTDAQVEFVNERLRYMFSTGREDRPVAHVIGTHVSKSCLLPVYLLRTITGLRIIARGNFHDWNLGVEADQRFLTPEGSEFFCEPWADLKKLDYGYWQGFPSGRVYKGIQGPEPALPEADGYGERYAPKSTSQVFGAVVDSNYDLYALCRFLTQCYAVKAGVPA